MKMSFSDCWLWGTQLTEGSNYYVLKSIPRFVPRSCFPQAAANAWLSKVGRLRQARWELLALVTLASERPVSLAKIFLRLSLWSETFPFSSFLCPSQESHTHTAPWQRSWPLLPPAMLFLTRHPPNKSLVHLTSSWALPLGGPRLTQNLTS